MALVKRTYVDGETIITAQNLNDIQDEIIAHASTFVPNTRTIGGVSLAQNRSVADIGAAPTSHASASTTYGKGTSSNYGHVKISDSLTDTTTASTGGTVPSMKAVSDLNTAIGSVEDSLTLNSFENITLVDNAYVDNTNGNFVSYNGWQRTDYIPVESGNTYIIMTTNGSSYNAVYDSNKNFIRSFQVGKPSTEMSFASNEKYIAMSFVSLTNVVKIKIKTLYDDIVPNTIKVMTFNVGLYNYGTSEGIPSAQYNEKIVNYRRFFGEQGVNIAGLQETPVNVSSGHEAFADLYSGYFNYRRENGPYLSIYSNIPLKSTGFSSFSTGRAYNYATFDLAGNDVYFLNVHYHPSNATYRATEIGETLALLDEHEYSILTGDFNLAPGSEQSTQYARFTSAGYKLGNLGWFGDWWTWSTNQADFSNYDNPSGTVWYIDTVIVSSNLYFKNVYCPNTYAKLSSDHIPCVAEISLY